MMLGGCGVSVTVSPGKAAKETYPEAPLREVVGFTIESMVALLQRLPATVGAVPTILSRLRSLDSRALAAFLKELAKKGLTGRAFEVFDYVRDTLSLAPLCDVYTYTTMVALCGHCQALGQAVALVAEMRSRGIPQNVHTYSALMSTAIKSNELEQALDIFRQMQVDGFQGTVVTYNTLIDVYGKLGRWQNAVAVLDLLAAQDLEPQTRTFNTIIIACNMCGQPHEALRVYGAMLAAGYQPTATTYTAVITAHGKADQVDCALAAFYEMRHRGCERTGRTYSSLLGVCERSGQWQLVLSLVSQLREDHVQPNTLIYNTLLAACAQGGQAVAAQEFFTLMQAQGCQPDVVTFGSLLRTYQRAEDWRAALRAYQEMGLLGCRPNALCFSAVIEALWVAQHPEATAQVRDIFDTAVRAGCFCMAVHQRLTPDGRLTATLPGTGVAVALLALHAWLAEMVSGMQEGRRNFTATQVLYFGSDSKVRQDPQTAAAVQEAVQAYLATLESPFRLVYRLTGPQLEAHNWSFSAFLQALELPESIRSWEAQSTPVALHPVTAAYLQAVRGGRSPRSSHKGSLHGESLHAGLGGSQTNSLRALEASLQGLQSLTLQGSESLQGTPRQGGSLATDLSLSATSFLRSLGSVSCLSPSMSSPLLPGSVLSSPAESPLRNEAGPPPPSRTSGPLLHLDTDEAGRSTSLSALPRASLSMSFPGPLSTRLPQSPKWGMNSLTGSIPQRYATPRSAPR